MKRIFFLVFIIGFIFSACKKNDDYVFKQSPDERINAAIASYQSKLTTADNGWKALITVNGGNGATFSFYFKFSDQNRVKMFSDFDSTSAVTIQESSYRLKAEQQPTLIFDTYSYVHVLADPNEGNVVVQANINGGPVGKGLLSDFEFIFDNAKIKADTIELLGKVNNSKLVLVKATKAEGDAYNGGQLGAGFSINKILTYFKRLTIGSQLIDVSVNTVTRTFTFTWLDANGNAQTFSTTYYLTVGGIVLTNPLVIGTLSVKSFTNISWDPTAQTVNFTANSTPATIKGVVVPLKVDVGAPKRWYDYAVNNGGVYWTSFNGFHANGVDDAFGIKSLVSGANTYYYLIYWPKYAAANDFFGPIFLNAARTGLSLLYGTAPKAPPTYTADGRAIFVILGNYGAYPATGAAGQSRTLLYNTSGHYFVQTGPTTFDMVNAADGKSWITWEWIF